MNYILKDVKNNYIYSLEHKEGIDSDEISYIKIEGLNKGYNFDVIQYNSHEYFKYPKDKGYKYNGITFFSRKDLKEFYKFIKEERIKILVVNKDERYNIQKIYKREDYIKALEKLEEVNDIDELVRDYESDIVDMRIRMLYDKIYSYEDLIDKCFKGMDKTKLKKEQLEKLDGIKGILINILDKLNQCLFYIETLDLKLDKSNKGQG